MAVRPFGSARIRASASSRVNTFPLKFFIAAADQTVVGTLIFLCCDRVAVDPGVRVVETDDVDAAVRAADGDPPVVILIGTRASADDAARAVAVVVARSGYFLHVRDDDSSAWLQRQIRYALGRRPK